MSLEIKRIQYAEPIYFHRDYEKDLSSKELKEASKVDSSWAGIAQRTAFASLPFFSLYKPFGLPLAMAMGSIRVLSSASELYGTVQKGDSAEISGQVLQTAIAVGALAGTILAHPLGMLITTGQDTLLDAGYLVYALSEGDYKAASERTFSLVNNALYLGLFFASSLELSIASLSVQVFLGLYHSADDFRNDRWVEGSAHLLMAGVRGNQLTGQIKTLQRKNEFERKIKAFINQAKEAESSSKAPGVKQAVCLTLNDQPSKLSIQEFKKQFACDICYNRTSNVISLIQNHPEYINTRIGWLGSAADPRDYEISLFEYAYRNMDRYYQAEKNQAAYFAALTLMDSGVFVDEARRIRLESLRKS